MRYKLYLIFLIIFHSCALFAAEGTLSPSSSFEEDKDESFQVKWQGFSNLNFVPRNHTFIFNIQGKRIVRRTWKKLTPEENRIIHSTPPEFIRRTLLEDTRKIRHKKVEFTLDPYNSQDNPLFSEEDKWFFIKHIYLPKIKIAIQRANDLLRQNSAQLTSALIGGSLASGYFTKDSDIDLILVLQNKIDDKMQMENKLRRMLREVFLLYAIFSEFKGNETHTKPIQIDINIYSWGELKNLLSKFHEAELGTKRIPWYKFDSMGAKDYSLLRGAVTIWGEDVLPTDAPSRNEASGFARLAEPQARQAARRATATDSAI